jgi:hypothetical protein
MAYPERLIAHNSFPRFLGAEEVKDYYFVRETIDDYYKAKSSDLDTLIHLILAPQPSEREVFVLSIILYGYYTDNDWNIKADVYEKWEHNMPDLISSEIKYKHKDKKCPLFLKAELLYLQSVDYNNNNYTLSFSHCPTRQNYWHFQLFTKDEAGVIIPRDSKNKSQNKRNKKIARYILSEYVKAAICPPEVVKPFRRADFDAILDSKKEPNHATN